MYTSERDKEPKRHFAHTKKYEQKNNNKNNNKNPNKYQLKKIQCRVIKIKMITVTAEK